MTRFPTSPENPPKTVAIIGGGPAGLMAAEQLSQAGFHVSLYEAKPSVGRKFLYAGKSGLNLTHAEALTQFITRYGAQQTTIASWLERLSPQALRDWAQGLDISTFVGSSGRVFPKEMKAAPLLRAWVHRLREQGVQFYMRHQWHAWSNEQEAKSAPKTLRFDTPLGEKVVTADAVVLALGGGSWAALGSDGKWFAPLTKLGIATHTLRPANCGFTVSWSPYFIERFVGKPVKTVSIALPNTLSKQGEFVISQTGVEGSLIYAFSAPLRDEIEKQGYAILYLDLLPDWSHEKVLQAVAHPRGSRSLSSHLKTRLKLDGVKLSMLRECCSHEDLNDPIALAQAIKALPLRLNRTNPIDEAISTAGGIDFSGLNSQLMLNDFSGVFCAGEMLDWEAPTGGYLLTACFASGVVAAEGVKHYLNNYKNKQ